MSDADFLREEPPGFGGRGQPAPRMDYLRKLERAFKRGDPTDHTPRPALQELIEALNETFLQACDPKLRERRVAYDTPEPLVNYLVRSIDRLLKHKSGIKAGLADHSKIAVKCKEGGREITDETHRALILGPAPGTATFLCTVLECIRLQFKTRKSAGPWASSGHEHLPARLFAFELLMAPYAVAHCKTR